jgi:hypothetical protein
VDAGTSAGAVRLRRERDRRGHLVDALAVPELEHEQRPEAAGLDVGAGGMAVDEAADRALVEVAAVQ